MLLNIESEISEDYNDYITKYILTKNNVNDVKYDMLTLKISKFTFYNINNYSNQLGIQKYLMTNIH